MKEKYYPILRYCSVFVEFIFGFIQPYFFSKYLQEQDFAFLITLYGCMIYFVFLDGGISRLAYSNIRKKFIIGESVRPEIVETLSFYTFLTLFLIIAFSIFSIIVSTYFQNTISFLVLLFFSILSGFNIIFSYLRFLFNSIDKYILYEKVDIARKVINIIGVTLIIFDSTLLSTVFFSLSVILILLFILVNKILIISEVSWREIFPTVRKIKTIYYKYQKDTKRIIIFSISEAVIYNCGFLLAPIQLSHFDVILFGIWMKIYTGLAVFMRSITDINIHTITKSYFQKDYDIAYGKFIKTLLMSIVFSLISVVIFIFSQNWFFHYWIGAKYIFNQTLLIALMIMLFGNTIQHISGSFLLAEVSKLNFMKKLSLLLCIVIGAQMIISMSLYKNLEVSLILFASIYFIGSFFYLKSALLKIKNI